MQNGLTDDLLDFAVMHGLVEFNRTFLHLFLLRLHVSRHSHIDERQNQRDNEQNNADRRCVTESALVERGVVDHKSGHHRRAVVAD